MTRLDVLTSLAIATVLVLTVVQIVLVWRLESRPTTGWPDPMLNPANPASLVSPANPANPASPLHP